MNISDELQALMNTGLRFTIEICGGVVNVRVGNYLRQECPHATVETIEQAIDWLRRLIGPTAELSRGSSGFRSA